MPGSTHRKQISLCTAIALMLSFTTMTAQVSAQEMVAASVGSIAEATIGTSATHNFTEQGLASDYFDITGNLSTGKGTMTYNDITLTQCLKMESSTYISFTTGSACTMTLAIKDGDTIDVDNNKYTIDASGQTVISLSAGAHTLRKGSGSSNLFYIDISGGSGIITNVTTDTGAQQTTTATTASVAVTGDLNVKSVGGWNEMAYMIIGGIHDDAVKKVSYSGETSGTLNGDDFDYLVRDTDDGVRIIGNVTAPAGLTAFDSVDYGGSVGDNGYMARMQSGKDVTIEGVGTDACINGWGIHFIAESSNQNAGKSFEVRNITFRNVPEDCVGMEGVQEGSTLTASVEHCWIHNCEFYKPAIANPAESDKDGGDGACDFKRGMYFTNSYCYYEGYHKTNLVGASDSNLQFHITFHHNYWKNCESRGPLARQANIHMYNNIFEGQTSYCMNPRANAYIFSEYNVFESCKNPMQVKLGAVKSYMDVLNNCKGDQDGTVVTDKNTQVDTDCQYANFDTNASVSYIPSGNYLLNTDTVSLKSMFEQLGGCMKENASNSGVVVVAPSDSTTTTTTTTQTLTVTLLGDVNCDGDVKVNDVILLNRFLSEDEAISISSQGMVNADVNASGSPDGNDAVDILKQLASLN